MPLSDMPAPRIRRATRFMQRFIGLMGSRPLPAGQALLITQCSSVHTWFMRYTIDVVYLDRDYNVVRLVCGLKPWRFNWGHRHAVYALEFTAGGAASYQITCGASLKKWLA